MKNEYKGKIIGLSIVANLMLGSSAYAGKIISDADVNNIIVEEDKQFGFGGWNFENINVRVVNIGDFNTAIPGSNFDTETGIYTTMGSEMSFESDIKNSTGTVMGHLHGKDWPVGEPAGIKVINGDTKTKHGKPENCIMTSSYQEYQIDGDDTSGTAYLDAFSAGDMPRPVICSSPWQTHKRYKINLLPTTVKGVEPGSYGKPVDLVFNLDPTDTSTDITRYQILQKANNYTGMRLDGIKIEVLDENGLVNDSLTLSLGEGEGDTGLDIWGVGDMANMSHGLWGPYEEGRFDNGFFDYQGVYFDVNLTNNNHTIDYIGPMLGGNYQELFGNWLPSIWEPMGIFYDEDHNPATDNILQAFLGVAPGFTERTWYKSSVVYDPVTPNIKPVYTWLEATEQDLIDWSGDWYNEGPIEDVLNLGLNYIINVGENAKIGSTFILRITPHIDMDQTPPSSFVSHFGNAFNADFNGDGIDDILWRNTDGRVVIWYMNSDGTYSSYLLTTEKDSWSIEDANDFNKDGIADILWRNTDGRVVIWYMNSDGTYDHLLLTTEKDSWSIENTSDFNGDSIADILWRNTDGRVVIWYMNSDGTYDHLLLTTEKDSWSIENTSDFNGDSIADILWRNTDGRVVIWYMNSDGTYDHLLLTTEKDSWSIEDANDFNKDGIADILWRNTDGRVVIWYMNSDGTYDHLLLTTEKDSWSIENTSDFNGDSIADILWRNTDGRVVIWYMNSDGTYDHLLLTTEKDSWSIEA